MKTLLLIALASLAVALPAGAGTTATPTLTGTVGPGFTITLTKGGTKVKTLKHGTYKVVLYDKSSIHNFDLLTPSRKTALTSDRKKVMTTVAKTGKFTFTVKLTPGTWRYVCDPHLLTMKGSFKVT